MDDIFYRAYVPDHMHYFKTVCMQWFDENDYDKNRFLKKDGEILQWKTEEEAEKYLIDNLKEDYIYPEILAKYRDHSIYFKEK